VFTAAKECLKLSSDSYLSLGQNSPFWQNSAWCCCSLSCARGQHGLSPGAPVWPRPPE